MQGDSCTAEAVKHIHFKKPKLAEPVIAINTEENIYEGLLTKEGGDEENIERDEGEVCLPSGSRAGRLGPVSNCEETSAVTRSKYSNSIDAELTSSTNNVRDVPTMSSFNNVMNGTTGRKLLV